MSKMNKPLIMLNLFIFNTVFCGGLCSKLCNRSLLLQSHVSKNNSSNCTDEIKLLHNLPYCVTMCMALAKNRSLKQIQSLLSCSCCKKRAFTSLVHFVKGLGENKSEEIAEMFIQNGINPNDYNDLGELALITASQWIMIEAVKFMISLKVDINKRDIFNRNALMQAIYHSTLNDEDRLQQLDVVKLLLNSGANPNLFDSTGETPLHYATLYNLNEVVYLLLIYGANTNILYKGENFFGFAKNNPEVLQTYARFKKFNEGVDKILL